MITMKITLKPNTILCQKNLAKHMTHNYFIFLKGFEQLKSQGKNIQHHISGNTDTQNINRFQTNYKRKK